MLHRLKSMEEQRYKRPVNRGISTLSSFYLMLELM